jgi:hypothetical protein
LFRAAAWGIGVFDPGILYFCAHLPAQLKNTGEQRGL